MPVVLNASDYGSRWVRWWTEAQPHPRDRQEWPLQRDVDVRDAQWRRFPAHGQNSLFLAVMATCWWAQAVKSAEDVTLFEDAVGDLNWIIQQLIRTRSGNESPPQPSLPLQSQPTHQDPPPLSLPPLSSSRLPPSSSRSLLPPGVCALDRGEGKRVVRPSRRLRESLA